MVQGHGGVVVAGHSRTAEAGVEILSDGGNAFDAVIAALLMSFVAEPCMSSPGGGAFATLAGPDINPQVYDFFVQTPHDKRPLQAVDFFPVTVDFGDATEDFHVGMGSVAVPGAIAGVFALHRAHATMPMSRLLEPALRAAKEGVIVDGFQRYDFELLDPILSLDPAAKPYFYPKGALIKEGDLQRIPELGTFLEALGREGPDLFYKGDIPRQIIQASRARGGHLTLEDFEAYQVEVHPPLEVAYRGHRILTNPLPSVGGGLIALALRDIARFEAEGEPFPLYRGLQEMARLGQTPGDLPRRLQQLFGGEDIVLPSPPGKGRSTTHMGVVDRDGNAAAISTSNGEGSGYFIPGTGVQLNNMLGEAALLPGGFESWVPNTRLASMMAPTLVVGAQGVEMITGTGGAGRIPGAITQVIYDAFVRGLDVEDAVEGPRMHIAHGELNLETGVDTKLYPKVPEESLRQWSGRAMFFGGVHTILRRGGTFEGQGDSRRWGVAKALD